MYPRDTFLDLFGSGEIVLQYGCYTHPLILFGFPPRFPAGCCSCCWLLPLPCSLLLLLLPPLLGRLLLLLRVPAGLHLGVLLPPALSPLLLLGFSLVEPQGSYVDLRRNYLDLRQRLSRLPKRRLVIQLRIISANGSFKHASSWICMAILLEPAWRHMQSAASH